MIVSALLAMAPPQSPPGTQPNPTGEMIKMFAMLAIFGVMFYLLFIRPQQKRAREQADMLKSVKSGDKIVTTSGILGVVVSVKEKSVSLRSADSKLEVTKSAIAEILERGGESGNS